MEAEKTSNWGELLPLEGTMQITGSMLNMRNPKRYKIEALKSEKSTDSVKLVRSIPVCQHTKTTLKIQEYISETELADIDKKKLTKFQTLIHKDNPSEVQRVVSAPQILENKFDSQSYGLKTSVVDSLTRKAIATIAFKTGFTKTTNSTLNVLEHVTAEYLTTISKSLKLIYENEAMTGRTGMFDAVDQVLHDHGIRGIPDLSEFYKHNVIEHNGRLLSKVKEKVEIENKASKKRVLKLPTATIKSEVGEQELSWNYAENQQSTSSRWLPFVKTEPLNKPQVGGGPSYNNVGEHSAYINTFRPISPQTEEDYKPNKKKMRSSGYS